MLALTILMWSGNAIVARAIRADVPPITLSMLRWFGAAMLIAPFAARTLARDGARLRAGWKSLAFLCLFGVLGYNALLYAGLQWTTATNAMLMSALIPGLVLLIGWAALGVREPAARIAGITLSVAGALYTVFRGDLDAALNLHLGRGEVLLIFGCVSWALYTVGLRFAPKVHAASFLFVTFIGAAIILLPIAIVTGEIGEVNWNPRSLAGIAYVAVFPSAAAFYLYNKAVARVGPAIGGLAITMLPICGAGLAALVLGEPLHGYHAIGIVLILIGVIVAGRSRPLAPA